MNVNTSLALLAVIALVGTLTTSAYALEKAYPGIDGDIRESAEKMLLSNIPISVWTDQSSYGSDSMIKVSGQVANMYADVPVTLTVTNPLNSIVRIDQINPNEDGSFETMINTTGDSWKYDGTYIIKVNYGSVEKSNKVFVELTNRESSKTMPEMIEMDSTCTNTEISADGNCIPFTISGGMMTGASINLDDKSIVFKIDTYENGMLTVNPSEEVINDIVLVFVDGEEWNDIKIDGNEVTVMFLAGAEEIEIIGTWVIPEFGTIAIMILAVAIISIIAISARSRLSIMPRY